MIYVKATNTGCTAAAVVTHLSTFSTSILCRVNLTGQQQFKQKASVKKLPAHYPSLGMLSAWLTAGAVTLVLP
jgi:hypothetical protein